MTSGKEQRRVSIALRLANMLLDPAVPGSVPSIPENFMRNKLSMLLTLINGAA